MDTQDALQVVDGRHNSGTRDNALDEQDDYNVEAAISDLFALDLDTLPYDKCSQDIVRRASDTLVQFLDSVIDHGGVCRICDAITTGRISAIFRVSMLDKLFAYRQIFLRIADCAQPHSSETHLVVCWVDVLLVKIGDAVLATMGWSKSTTLSRHTSHSTLRASLQLPEAFPDVPYVISSNQASPAAIRLAVQLTFAAYVMGPQLNNAYSWPEHSIQPEDIIQLLLTYLRSRSPICNNPSPAQQEQILAERTTHAMVISLFAMADTIASETRRVFRPHTLATLLAFIQSIMRPANSDFVQIPHPQELDTAQRLLLGSWTTLKWCWSMWHEQRVAHTVILDVVTATWLFHLGRCVHDGSTNHEWRDTLVLSVERNSSAACSTFMSLLQCTISDQRTRPPLDDWISIIHKACWGITALLRAAMASDYMVNHDLPRILIRLFMTLDYTPTESTIKNVILEGICYVDSSTLRNALEGLQVDHVTSLSAHLESELASLSCSHRTERNADTASPVDLESARQFLQFLALVWHSGYCGISPPDAIYAFVTGISTSLCSRVGSLELLDAYVSARIAFGTLEHGQGSPLAALQNVWEDDKILRLALSMFGIKRNPMLLFSLTGLVVTAATRSSCSQTTLLLSWDIIRDMLVLALRSRVPGLREALFIPLTVILSTALYNILTHAEPGTLHCICSSPWSRGLRLALNEAMENERWDQSPILQQRLAAIVAILSAHSERQHGAHSIPTENDETGYNRNEREPVGSLTVISYGLTDYTSLLTLVV